MRDLKQTITDALNMWVSQRPGLDYGNPVAYRAEVRPIGKDLQHARAMINYVTWHDSITAEMILDAADNGGRLSIVAKGGTVAIDYCTGQYWPTEYRPAVCRLLSSVIWDYWWAYCMPEGVLVHNSETGETFKRYQGLRAGDYLRRQAARELGTSIARRWFA